MAGNSWVVTTGSTALSAATAKTAIELTTSSTAGNDWTQCDISFNGTTSTAVPVTCEVITYGTTGTGTAITFAGPHRVTAKSQAMALNPATTAKVNLTVEGTTSIVVVRGWFIHPQAGQSWQMPLGREWGMKPSMIYGIRLTAPAVVNYIANLEFEES